MFKSEQAVPLSCTAPARIVVNHLKSRVSVIKRYPHTSQQVPTARVPCGACQNTERANTSNVYHGGTMRENNRTLQRWARGTPYLTWGCQCLTPVNTAFLQKPCFLSGDGGSQIKSQYLGWWGTRICQKVKGHFVRHGEFQASLDNKAWLCLMYVTIRLPNRDGLGKTRTLHRHSLAAWSPFQELPNDTSNLLRRAGWFQTCDCPPDSACWLIFLTILISMASKQKNRHYSLWLWALSRPPLAMAQAEALRRRASGLIGNGFFSLFNPLIYLFCFIISCIVMYSFRIGHSYKEMCINSQKSFHGKDMPSMLPTTAKPMD